MKADVLILTGLREELRAVLALLPRADFREEVGLPMYETALTSPGVRRRVVVLPLSYDADVATERTTLALAHLDSPLIVLMTVGAGIEGRARPGDVVVAKSLIFDRGRHAPVPCAPQQVQDSRKVAEAWAQRDDGLSLLDVRVGIVAASNKPPSRQLAIGLTSRHSDLKCFAFHAEAPTEAYSSSPVRPPILAIVGIASVAGEGPPENAMALHIRACAHAAAFTVDLIRATTIDEVHRSL